MSEPVANAWSDRASWKPTSYEFVARCGPKWYCSACEKPGTGYQIARHAEGPVHTQAVARRRRRELTALSTQSPAANGAAAVPHLQAHAAAAAGDWRRAPPAPPQTGAGVHCTVPAAGGAAASAARAPRPASLAAGNVNRAAAVAAATSINVDELQLDGKHRVKRMRADVAIYVHSVPHSPCARVYMHM
jgi:hypothetical protein